MKHPYEDKLRHRSILSCYRRMVTLILILILSILTSSGYSKLKPSKKAKESFVTRNILIKVLVNYQFYL